MMVNAYIILSSRCVDINIGILTLTFFSMIFLLQFHNKILSNK